jgi:Fuc2NAc and GlcNAc transferase
MMGRMTTLLVFASLVASTIATGLMRQYALREKWLDLPNSRSSHQSPTPRGGGVAIVIVFFLSTLVLVLSGNVEINVALPLCIGGGLMALIGFIDDRSPQPALVRFAIHILAATIAVALLTVGLVAPWQRGSTVELWLSRFLAVVTLAWVSNLFNFMDGIDGIAAGEAIFIMMAAAWLHWYSGGDWGLTSLMINLAAATIGFVIWNWPPAKIFMGDAGSGFLGFMIGAFALYTCWSGALPVFAWVILGGVFLTDATVTLIRRMLRGDRWMEPHRMHAYQHLARRWNAHLPVTALTLALNVLWLFPLAFLSVLKPRLGVLWVSLAILPLIGGVVILGAGRPSDNG